MKRKQGVFDFSVIRKLRKRDDLTLQDVSNQSGIGLAVLSKLERNMSNAELDTLRRVARVFDLSVSELIALAEEPPARILRPAIRQSGEFSLRSIGFCGVRCLEVWGPNGARMDHPEIHREDYELCWVMDGVLRVEMPNERYDLEAGHALMFDAVWDHKYEAMDDCRFVIIHVPKDKMFEHETD